MKNHLILILLTIMLSFVCFPIFTEELPRIAVIPFNSINVSETDTEAVTDLFEAALVKTNVFTVIAQNEI